MAMPELKSEASNVRIGIVGNQGRVSNYFLKNYEYSKFPIQLNACVNNSIQFSNSENFTHVVIASGKTNLDYCNQQPVDALDLNLIKTLNLIDILLQNSIIPIFLSSVQVYKNFSGLVNEEFEKTPLNVYGQMKLAVEKYLDKTAGRYLIFRIGNIIFGELGYGDKIEETLSLIQNNDRIAVDQVLNLVHIRDLHQAINFATHRSIHGVYNISNSEIRTRGDLTTELMSKIDNLDKAQINYCQYKEIYSHSDKVYLNEMSSIKLITVFGSNTISNIKVEIPNYNSFLNKVESK